MYMYYTFVFSQRWTIFQTEIGIVMNAYQRYGCFIPYKNLFFRHHLVANMLNYLKIIFYFNMIQSDMIHKKALWVHEYFHSLLGHWRALLCCMWKENGPDCGVWFVPPSHSFRLFKPPSTSHAQEVGVSSMHSESGKRLINVIGHLNDIQVLVQFIHNYYSISLTESFHL